MVKVHAGVGRSTNRVQFTNQGAKSSTGEERSRNPEYPSRGENGEERTWRGMEVAQR